AVQWYWRARTRYDVHSPYLVEFIEEVYRDDRYYDAFTRIPAIRKSWAGRKEKVALANIGAPSKTTSKSVRSASSLVADNAINDRCGQLLFRLAIWLKARNIIEFGTNAGISTLYLHAADTQATLHTVEGNPKVAALAQETFQKAETGPGLRPHIALFYDWLNKLSDEEARPLDLFFLDGDHRKEPTLEYVRSLLPRATEHSVFVIADIHWSQDMEQAWEQLQKLPEVTATLDLYHFGLLFFRKGMEGPHLGLLPTRYKPWRLGFFS
ncbi:MAG: class I SAM-dependent methyltransferase, partial [Bacteroidota bacterium]